MQSRHLDLFKSERWEAVPLLLSAFNAHDSLKMDV